MATVGQQNILEWCFVVLWQKPPRAEEWIVKFCNFVITVSKTEREMSYVHCGDGKSVTNQTYCFSYCSSTSIYFIYCNFDHDFKLPFNF